MERLQDLRNKEVIDIFDGKRLGFVCDCEIDIYSGRLVSIVVPHGSGRFSFMNKQEDLIIPWVNIKKIGSDIIIVDTRSHFTSSKGEKCLRFECK